MPTKLIEQRTMGQPFKGNKQSLPSKLCVQCGRPMQWRKAWARNWAEVLVCSDACRTLRKRQLRSHGTG